MARSKYFFRNPGSPNFRLMEDEDDNGRKIEEPELYRPTNIDDYTYNVICEQAIHKWKDFENAQSQNRKQQPSPAAYESPVLFKSSSPKIFQIDDDDDCEISIQCAQRQPINTGLTNSPRRPLTQLNNIVDLVSPIATISSQEHVNIIPSSSSTHRTPLVLPKYLIIGRRLFEGKEDENNVSNYKNKSPLRQLLNNFEKDPAKEVEFLGQKLSNSTSINMSQQTYELYNMGLSLGNSSSSSGKENLFPKRIPRLSRFLQSPYDVNPSPNLSMHDIVMSVWHCVTTFCDDPVQKLEWAIRIDNVRVSMLQLGGSSKLNGWVQAWYMNAFCRKLFRDKHPRFSKKHFFFNTISDFLLDKFEDPVAIQENHKKSIDSFQWANKAMPLEESDGLYFPTLSHSHWFVFLVDIKYRSFIFLDSLFGQNSVLHTQIDNQLIQNFEKLWFDAGLSTKINFRSYGRAYPNVPQQITPNDCGIFTMKFMELFVARFQANCKFSPQDIPLFRAKYAHDMLMSPHNEIAKFKQVAPNFNN